MNPLVNVPMHGPCRPVHGAALVFQHVRPDRGPLADAHASGSTQEQEDGN